eukprot:jgi/Mesvir1/7014/Mv09146-RA.1
MPEADEVSMDDLKGQIYTSLRGAGVIDALKTQLRSQILRHLKRQDSELLSPRAESGDLSLKKRLVNSLFIDYLKTVPYSYSLSVFLPECGMASANQPLSRHEMLEVMQIHSSSKIMPYLCDTSSSGGAPSVSSNPATALVVELLDGMSRLQMHSAMVQSATQTSSFGDDIGGTLREVENLFLEKVEAERLLPYRTLEERMVKYRKECDDRAREEIAVQVARVRQFEVGSVKMEEAARYRRQLEEARADLEAIHADRLERLREREESHMLRLRQQEKAMEAAAFEHRQKIIAENEALRAMRHELDTRKDVQDKAHALMDERLSEREGRLKEREGELARLREHVLAQADEASRLRQRDLEADHRAAMQAVAADRETLKSDQARFRDERQALLAEVAEVREARSRHEATEARLLATERKLEDALFARKQAEERLTKALEDLDGARAKAADVALDLANCRQQLSDVTLVTRSAQSSLEAQLEAARAETSATREALAAEREAWARERALHAKEAATAQGRIDKMSAKLDRAEADADAWVLRERRLQAAMRRAEQAMREMADGRDTLEEQLQDAAVTRNALERQLEDAHSLVATLRTALAQERDSRHALMLAPQSTPVYGSAAAPGTIAASVAAMAAARRFPPPPSAAAGLGQPSGRPLDAAITSSSMFDKGGALPASMVKLRLEHSGDVLTAGTGRSPSLDGASGTDGASQGPTRSVDEAMRRLQVLEAEEKVMERTLASFRQRLSRGRATNESSLAVLEELRFLTASRAGEGGALDESGMSDASSGDDDGMDRAGAGGSHDYAQARSGREDQRKGDDRSSVLATRGGAASGSVDRGKGVTSLGISSIGARGDREDSDRDRDAGRGLPVVTEGSSEQDSRGASDDRRRREERAREEEWQRSVAAERARKEREAERVRAERAEDRRRREEEARREEERERREREESRRQQEEDRWRAQREKEAAELAEERRREEERERRRREDEEEARRSEEWREADRLRAAKEREEALRRDREREDREREEREKEREREDRMAQERQQRAREQEELRRQQQQQQQKELEEEMRRGEEQRRLAGDDGGSDKLRSVSGESSSNDVLSLPGLGGPDSDPPGGKNDRDDKDESDGGGDDGGGAPQDESSASNKESSGHGGGGSIASWHSGYGQVLDYSASDAITPLDDEPGFGVSAIHKSESSSPAVSYTGGGKGSGAGSVVPSVESLHLDEGLASFSSDQKSDAKSESSEGW